MSFAYDVYYAGPRDGALEETIRQIAEGHGGDCTYWDDSESSSRITLTLEFDSEAAAKLAMEQTTAAGHYAEGPYLYG